MELEAKQEAYGSSSIPYGAVKKESARQFSVEDLLKYKLIKDVQISRDDEVVFEIKSIDEKKDSYKTEIWIASVQRNHCFEFTKGKGGDWYPRWSPDGKRLAFLSDRDAGKSQLYVIERDGGEARQLSCFNESVSSIEWSPQGRHLIAGVTVPVEEKPEDESSSRWEKRPQIVTHQRYKSDSAGFLLQSHIHLFSVSLDGDAKQLTEGGFDVTSSAWSPDGAQIAFCRSRTGFRESHISDVWIMDSDGRNARQVSDNVPSAMKPSWSPDGRWIVFMGSAEAGDSMKGLWLIDVQSGKCRQLGPPAVEVSSFPLARTTPAVWSGDSKKIAFLFSREGLSEVACVDVASGELSRIVTGERQITNLHANDRLIAFAGGSITEPNDISVVEWDGSKEKRLTHLNKDWWNKRASPKVTRRKFKADGKEIDGWLILPPGHDKGKAAPLLLDVHGGPHSYVEFGFPYHVYWYALASKGWGVLSLNTIGSSSYGRSFAQALRGRWGELDFPQHLQAIEQLQNQGIANSTVAIAGKSYGGYMAAWAIGHSSVFRAAVVSAPVSNLESHACTSDSGYYVVPYDMGGELDEKRELFRRLSPVQYLHAAKTPTLILQGEKDERCPPGQSEEVFSILMRKGKAPVEMVVYPGGHHDLAEDGRPSHRIHYHGRVVEWCEQWRSAERNAPD